MARTSCPAQPERKPNGVRFPWKLRRVPIAWPRDRHVEEHWHRRRNQNLWKVWALGVLTGRPWLLSLEGRFSVAWIFHSVVTPWLPREKQKRWAKLRTTRTAVCVTRQSHQVFFQDGLSKRTVDFEKQWKVMSQATAVRRLCWRVCGGLVSERSPSAQLLWTTFEGDLRLVVLWCLTELRV